MHFTVAIPIYNGAARLPRLLERLKAQTGTEDWSWEIICVDNNSTDETAQVIQRYQASWPQASSLIYLFEARQGASFARHKAINAANSQWIGFIDDDVLPNRNWVEQAYQFAQTHPQAGAFSGQIHGAFEIDPPNNFEKIQSFLAIIEQGETTQLYHPKTLNVPNTAALVVNKQAWQHSVPKRQFFAGRVGHSLVGAEDFEALLYLRKKGWQIWYNPAMHVTHHIPKYRLEKDYLLSLSHSCGLSVYALRRINSSQKHVLMLRILLGSDLRRAITHFWYRHRQSHRDLVTDCQMAFYWGILLSPLYFLRCRIQAALSPPAAL